MVVAQLDVAELRAALDRERQARGLTWSDVAREAGVSPSTLTRLARGGRPDVDGFASLVWWLRAPADTFLVPVGTVAEDPLWEIVGAADGPDLVEDERSGRVSEHVDEIVYGE